MQEDEMGNNGIIKALMESKGVKARQVANDAGISKSYFHLIASGYNCPLSTKLKVAKALNVSPTYLFRLTDAEIKVVFGMPNNERTA